MTPKNELWQSEAAKLGGNALVEKIISMADSLEKIAHIEIRVTNTEADIQKLYSAFPSRDTDGHRRAHEAMIEDINTRKRLTQAIQEKTISGLIWAALMGIGLAVWHEAGRYLK